MKKNLILFLLAGNCLFADAQTPKPQPTAVATTNPTPSIYQMVGALLHLTQDTTAKIITVDGVTLTNNLSSIYAGDSTAILNALNSNPILSGRLTFQAPKIATHGSVMVPSSIAGNFSNLDVTNLANAVASLMIDRAKQELTLAFFNHLQDFSKKYPEFQTLFPKTSDALRNLLSYTYPQMLPALRTAFLADLQQVPGNLEAVMELQQFSNLLNNFPEVQMAVHAIKIVHDLQNGVTPVNAITSLNQEAVLLMNPSVYKNASPDFKNLITAVRFAQLFSQSLIDDNAGHVWISPTNADALLHNPQATRIYLALLWQQVKTMGLTYTLGKNATTMELQQLILNNKDNILLIQNKLSAFIDQAKSINIAYTALKASGSNDNYFNFVTASLDGIDDVLGIVKVVDTSLQADDYLTTAKKTNILYKDIYSKQYTQAVSDAIDILSDVEQLTHYSKAKAGTAFSGATAQASYQQSSATLFTFVDKVKPYALFIANVADAKSEADIESALDNAILPVGSSSIKKNTKNNLSVQAYLGAYYTTYNYNPTAIRAWSDRFGVYGPIGLAYTPGLTSWGKYGALSLFGSVFDLGAIIDYKLKQDPTVTSSTNSATNSTATKQYSVNLGQIFSPGVHVVYGFFANLPLSLGFGAQYGPGLSKIDATGTTSVINPSWRFNVFLTVDLPFFTLINKTRQ